MDQYDFITTQSTHSHML